jgi:tRNA U34 5-methylaminomethyl-2-thiouridine-forming methyltransferase MnmC
LPIITNELLVFQPIFIMDDNILANPQYIIQSTDDGSSTIYLPQLDEHYHSIKGALAESTHIYINCAFRHRLESMAPSEPINVLEIGFGTGLNAALTVSAASGSEVHYSSIELYPINDEQVNALNYGSFVDPQLFIDLHAAPWNTTVEIRPNFFLNKIHANFLTAPLPSNQDVVYYDAFAPEKQPDMWSLDMFLKVYNAMSPQAVLSTYCAKGAIRRQFSQIGLAVERLAGPPQGKREILRATKS